MVIDTTVVGVRINVEEAERFAALMGTLAVPVYVPVSTIVKACALAGLAMFERKQSVHTKPEKGKKQ